VVVMEVFHGAILVAGVMLVVPLLPLNPLLLSVMATGVIGPRPSILRMCLPPIPGGRRSPLCLFLGGFSDVPLHS
jgi:hypothetical protein